MTTESLLIGVLVSLITTLVAIPYFIRFFNSIGIVGTDQQKSSKPVIPQAGGIPVFFGFTLGVLAFIFFNTYTNPFNPANAEHGLNLTLLFASLLSMSVIAMTGFFDDLNIRSQKILTKLDTVDYRVGLKQWQKPLLTLVAAIPLIAVRAGTSYISLPLMGVVHLGPWYALILIPLAVVCVSNAANMLAGFNGLEAGMTSVLLAALGIFLIQGNQFEAGIIALCAAAALLAFLKFNFYPAQMFPGDSLTYFAGAAIIAAAVIGNAEKFTFILFLPWITEAFLKLRGRFAVRSYGDLQKDGTLRAPYSKVYSLPHAVMKLPFWLGLRKGFTEKQVAGVLIGLEIILAIATLAFYQFFQY